MIVRMFLFSPIKHAPTFHLEQQIDVKKLSQKQITFNFFFRLMLKKLQQNQPTIFEDQSVRFLLFEIVYWTKINGQKRFYTLELPFRGDINTLPSLIKRSKHHLVDLHVQYTILEN